MQGLKMAGYSLWKMRDEDDMQESGMTVSDIYILEKCQRIELLSRKLYEFFADIYSDNPEINALWLKTAAEEQNHADQFSMALKMRKNLSITLNIDKQKADFVINQLLKLIEKFELTPPVITDALSASIKLENYLADFHLVCVASFEDNTFKKMFQAMMAGDQQHIASLQAAYDKLKGI